MRASVLVEVVRPASYLLIGAIFATACANDVTGRPFGPELGSGSSTGTVDTAGADDLTTSISAGGASDGDGTGGSTPDDDSGDSSSPGDTTDDGGSTGGVDPTDPTGASGGSGASAGSASTTGATGSDDGGSTGGSQGTALDPLLDIAESGEVCQMPGSLGECSGIATVCRFHDSQSGRCESCENCGNLNAFCNDGTECDILFACFAGRCTNFCTLGTQECGAVDDCLDVGHPTRGVCDPSAI